MTQNSEWENVITGLRLDPSVSAPPATTQLTMLRSRSNIEAADLFISGLHPRGASLTLPPYNVRGSIKGIRNGAVRKDDEKHKCGSYKAQPSRTQSHH